MANAKTISNILIRDTTENTGTGVQTNGRPFVVAIRTDHNQALKITVQGSFSSDFAAGELWQIDEFALPLQVVGTDLNTNQCYDAPFIYVRVNATALTSPTGGDLDIWINSEV